MPIVAKIIKTLRAEGSLGSAELMDKVNAPKRTFYRAVSVLRDSGVVVMDSGKYFWYEFLDTRAYKNELEANLALKHSSNIASGLKHMIEGYRSYFVEGELLPKANYVESALMHLKTGYGETYKLFEKAEETKKLVNKEELEFKERIKAKLLVSSLQTQYPENMAKIILDDIKEVLRGRKPSFLNDLQIKDGTVKSGGYTSLTAVGMFESLKHFMTEEEASKENRENCARIVERENRYYKLNQKFERETRGLVMQVENGTPLKGSCQMCPKVKIIKYQAEH